MAWTSGTLSSDYQAWFSADKPIIAANDMTGKTNTSVRWVASTSGTTASSDISATGYEAYRLFDGLPGRTSKPNTTGTAWSIVYDFSSDNISFDFIAVMNHNLKTLACSSFKVVLGSNSAFAVATELEDIDIDSGYSADRRFASYDMRHTGSVSRTYSSVDYARIEMTTSSGTPEIGQIIFGRRLQQRFQPDLPWDTTAQRSSMDELRSPRGIITRTARRKARREINATMYNYTALEESNTRAWWSRINGGAHPFIWVDNPSTSGDDFWLMTMASPDLIYPNINQTTRQLTVTGVEQGPASQYHSQGP